VDSTAKTSVPVLLRVLGGKDRGAGVIAAFHEFQCRASDYVAGLLVES
jgi:hypothetical protein